VTFTPTLTLELFAQPFIASGDYRDFKEYVRPRELATRKYAPSEIQTYRDTRRGIDTLYHITPADGGPAFDIYNPDFNARSLRGNAVLRWEYRPGSTIFFVWTQSRNDEAPQGDFDFGRDRAALFRSHADNIFQLKMNYWIGR
jgi:hypothetical protein